MKASMILSVVLIGLLAMVDGAGADPPRRGPRPENLPGRGPRPKNQGPRLKNQGPRAKNQPRRFPGPADAPYRVLRPANRPPGLADRALAPDASPDSAALPQGTGAVTPLHRSGSTGRPDMLSPTIAPS